MNVLRLEVFDGRFVEGRVNFFRIFMKSFVCAGGSGVFLR